MVFSGPIMKLDLNEQISKYFKLGELIYLPSWQIYCFPDVSQYNNLKKLALKMDAVREHFNSPINVHCALRPRVYNEQVKGAKQSAHIFGNAIDFDVSGKDCLEVKLELEKMLDELDLRMEDNGDNADWVHLDQNAPNTNRFFKP